MKAGMDEGRGDFKAPCPPPLLPMQIAARLFASLLVVLFLLLSPTPSLFPPAAALRQGVENKRYNALPLLLLPLLLSFSHPLLLTLYRACPTSCGVSEMGHTRFCLFSFTPHE